MENWQVARCKGQGVSRNAEKGSEKQLEKHTYACMWVVQMGRVSAALGAGMPWVCMG